MKIYLPFTPNIGLQTILFAWLFCTISCTAPKKEKTFLVGFSQCTLNDNWRKTMQVEMERELSFHPEIHFILKDANLNSQQQIKQVQELMDEHVDLLIVSPNEAAPITPIVNKAYQEGIPVIVVDRSTLSDNYTAYVGASNYKVGMSAGAYAVNLLKGKGNVIEAGTLQFGSSADIGRHNGFIDLIKNNPGIHYAGRFIGDWEKSDWDGNFAAFLKEHDDVQLIFSQNDRVALAAWKVCKRLGLDQKINILGIDGLSGKNGGIDLVERGIFKATILYPTGGKEAIMTAVNILENKPYAKQNELATTVIDSTNVRIMRLQTDKLAALQTDIDRSQKKIENQEIITRNQSNIIYAISISLAMALILGLILFYYLKENRKINARLALQNEEIITQRDQLIELSNKAREATEAKIHFFTNISHEFRTPLTLILGPLEEMMDDPKIHFTTKQYLALIQKNTIRLLRLINELIDFRKIEVNKMQLHASENDLVAFIIDIATAFNTVAQKRNIDLRVNTKERSLPIWFDVLMLDKVFFNLLSNAFKFTHEGGYITITVQKDPESNMAIVKLQDNGIGMSPEVAEHAFELFYQANITDQQGSGLGLSLSKELINLHHGTLTVSSKQYKGTCFTIQLPLGTANFKEEELMAKTSGTELMYHDERIYTAAFDKINLGPQSDEAVEENSSGHSVLIIEDNPELSNFLANRLRSNYEVFTANDGILALKTAFENIPDLIICDVILPGKDGISVMTTLKNDFKTSHIPIILLTAKIEVEEQIEGMKNMADAYMLKPFNLRLLEETMKSVMKNRFLLREHYTSELTSENKLQNPGKLDRKFINEFTAIIESNISNEKFTIDDISNAIGVSRVQLYRKVKALLGYNINDFILSIRLQKAKHYINEGGLSISEISYKVGFTSPAYFSTVFKSKFSITPSEYREKKKVNK